MRIALAVYQDEIKGAKAGDFRRLHGPVAVVEIVLSVTPCPLWVKSGHRPCSHNKKPRDNCRARRSMAAILPMLRQLSQQVEHGHCSERARVALPTFHVSHD